MYQPRRISGAPADRHAAHASAFRSAPRRAISGSAGLRTLSAPAAFSVAAVSVALLATSGVMASTVGASAATTPTTAVATTSTTTTVAPYRAEDSTSRDAARVALDEPEGQPAEEAPAASSEEAAPSASVAGSWKSSVGTVTGDQFAQSSVVVRAQAGDDAASVGKLAKGDKVASTDLTVAGYRQVSYQGKIGYVAADKLGDQAPSTASPAATAPASSTFFWPTKGSITSPWGMRLHPILGYTRLHGGVDMGGASGQPIYAAQDGVITKAATGYNSGSGNNIRIDHGTIGGKQLETAYLHMSTLKVSVGQRVKRGQLIGTVGSTGLSTAPHLHFSLYVKGVNSNPAPYLGR